jgi:hypothetical protein
MCENQNESEGRTGLETVTGIATNVVSVIRGFSNDDSEINSSLASLTSISSQLNEEEILVKDKLVLAAQKLLRLNCKGLEVISCLNSITSSTAEVLDCGVALERVISKYMNELDEKVMTKGLKEILDLHQEAQDALVASRQPLGQLITWCTREAEILPEAMDQKVARQRLSSAEKAAKRVFGSALGNRYWMISAVVSAISGFIESECLAVPHVKSSHESIIASLNNAAGRWTDILQKVRERQRDLQTVYKAWLALKEDAEKSNSFGSYILESENKEAKDKLEEKFVNSLRNIMSKCACEEFIDSIQTGRLSPSRSD